MSTIPKAMHPISHEERVAWAQDRVEEAARRVVERAHDDSLKLALGARLAELDALRKHG